MNALAVLLAAALALPAQHLVKGVEIGSDPKDAAVRLKGKEVQAPKHNGHSYHGGNLGGGKPVTCTENKLGDVFCGGVKQGSTGFSGGGGTVFTPGMARQAVAEIPMPGLALHVQPQGPTLVNVDTIFWAEPTRFETSITLLGHSIEIEATPTSFTWQHGDGSSQTTSEAGAPYPAKDVTHRYFQPATGLPARVDTTYSVRYSIDGGGWDDLGQDLTATGPATAIEVKEAAPVLVR